MLNISAAIRLLLSDNVALELSDDDMCLTAYVPLPTKNIVSAGFQKISWEV